MASPTSRLVERANELIAECDALNVLPEACNILESFTDAMYNARLKRLDFDPEQPDNLEMEEERATSQSGLVVSFEAAQRRFAERIAKREEQRAAQRELDEAKAARALEESRRYWLRELDTWPSAFRRRLRPFVEQMEAADYVCGPSGCLPPHQPTNRSQSRLCLSLTRVPDARAGQARNLPWTMIDTLGYLNAAIRDDEAAAHIEWNKARVLWELWVRGVRRLDREGELLRVARYKVQNMEQHHTAQLKYLPRRIAELEEQLRSGTVQHGPRAGKRFKRKGDYTRVRNELEATKREFVRCRQHLRFMPWAHESPIAYATGALPREGRWRRD